ncbi:MAG: hypothetical protein U9N53_10740, partial [Bacteroidota bacterium]|nr:hypothetical protein [Bacteroidota bacterium]
EKINQLVDYYLDGIYKQLVYGVYTDISVKNRSISAFFKYRFTNLLISNHFHPHLCRSDRYYYIMLLFQIRDE